MAADQRTALVGRLDGGCELGAGHLDPVLRCGGAVPTGHEELDDVSAALDLLAHTESERLGPVAKPHRA